MLAYAIIPASNRDGYRYLRTVFIREGRRELYIGNVDERSVGWVDLPPGSHRLSFVVSNMGKEVSFVREVAIQPRQILVAWCLTTYSLKPLNRHPRPNRWYIGVLTALQGRLSDTIVRSLSESGVRQVRPGRSAFKLGDEVRIALSAGGRFRHPSMPRDYSILRHLPVRSYRIIQCCRLAASHFRRWR